MHFLLQLDLANLPPGIGAKHGRGLLQMFYCLQGDCESARRGWEPFDSGHLLRIVAPESESPKTARATDCDLLPAREITGWEEAADLPHPEDHNGLGLCYSYNFDQGTVEIACSDLGLKIGPLPTREMISQDGLELAEAIGRCLAGDKLGGWPYWIQGAEYPSCPSCGHRMELLFQIDSEDNLPCMFGDAGCGHIMQCPRDRHVLAFGWACS